ncbi:hypothetical protein HA466_0007030 [Hirschfeldia incana]|nr:hypothetical protein HA466_0007030 [Hirschfeldia incana]
MMALIDVAIYCLNSIREIEEDVKDAIVYIDAGCTESFRLAGAFPLFLELGARAVCSLENMTSLDAVANWNSKFDCANRIVIMTSRLHSLKVRLCLSSHMSFNRPRNREWFHQRSCGWSHLRSCHHRKLPPLLR